MQIDLDELITQSRAKWFHSYSIVFGHYRFSNGESSVVVVIDIYHTKFEVEQRKFEGATFAEALEQFKHWLLNPGQPIAVGVSPPTPKKEEKKNEQLELL